MIGNISIGTNHGNCLSYDEKEGSEFISTNCSSDNYQKIAYEMETVAASNTRCKNNVIHISMSAPDGEQLSKKQWEQASQIVRRELGFTDHQQATTRHSDSKQDHSHITINRIDSEGRAWCDSKSYERLHAAMRTVEKEMNLERIEDHQITRDGRFEHTKTSMSDSIKAAKGKGLEGFKAEMKNRGYTVIENKSKTTGTVSGISIKNDETGKVYKASELRKGGWRGMEKQLNDQPKPEKSQSNNGGNVAAGKALANGVSKNLGKLGSGNPLKMPSMLPKLPMTGGGLVQKLASAMTQSVKKSRSIER